ncbi:putative NcrA-like major facilitator superfamily permease [Methylorubrum extorquens DM4]|uniref:NcrA-like major facilitator superfamily permease n=1 Tax=Methylorubrum extorquens (strain DSM 6343 / CIP 106787 / DM4) TaxID=661410 RepID=C7CEU4_METED|nr:MFS transporter [Methylorubrum extorquens]CAX22836.1 putative NcrA-like major facilitator superfamily permease [Methylorubrum extorquens DM4]
MLIVLANRTYRHLFAAQVVALVGTGLLTVALGLLAYRLAGAEAGAVLGTALAVKMVAYVLVAPVAQAFTGLLPRRAFLVATDFVRAGVALALPFIDQVWQVYVLMAVLQSASAAFTPTFQATIPDILPDERDYTRALSLSHLAFNLENFLSPALAALLLTVIDFHGLFAGTIVGFLGSAALVLSTTLPTPSVPARQAGIYERTTRGLRIYLATPRLRGLLALNLAVAAAGAMVIVNTVVLVQALLKRPQDDVAVALGLFGGGSMVAALLLPRILDRLSDRAVMIPSAALLGVVLLGFAEVSWIYGIGWVALLETWLVLGIGYSAAQTPTGRILRRSASPADRPALFAAQFALSHAAWLVTYPLAGWLGATVGMPATLVALGIVTLASTAAALLLWPSDDPETVEHAHPELDPSHSHLATVRGHRHAHVYVIDDLHHHWPSGRPG